MKSKIPILLFIGFITLLQHRVTAQADQQYLHKVGIIDSLYSYTLNESREIYIQLPASYTPDSKRKYPVVYILDGGVFINAVSTVHDFYYGGFMPEMILVGVSNRKNRTRDLTTSKIKTRRGIPFNEENGKAANFIEFMEKELVPFVEKKYPATNFRTLIGHSYGGLFAIYTLINHQHLFTNYLAIDPSLDWDNQKLLGQATKMLAEQEYQNKSLFMSLGGPLHMQNTGINIDNVMQDTSEYTLFARSNIEFSNLVKGNNKNGLFFKWNFYPREIHGTIPLPSIMDGLILLFEWFQMENTDKFNTPDTPKNELYDIVRNRYNKLHRHFGYPVPPYGEDLFNMLGYMNLEMQQPAKAKMFFEFAIEYYPQSANVYDSMADYYEAQKDSVNALKFVTKAYEISGDNYHKERLEGLKKKNK